MPIRPVSGQQSFNLDRGEQVQTLEAAKALLAAQVAAFRLCRRSPRRRRAVRIETESEVETEESEGLADDVPGREASDGRKPMRMATSAKRQRAGRGRPARR